MVLRKYLIAIIWTDLDYNYNKIYDIRGNDHFYIIILIYRKHTVWYSRVPKKDVFLSV